MNQGENKLVIFCGPSGSGKTTITRYLLSEVPGLGFSVSATTRERRLNEVEGEDYYFISHEEFQKHISAGDFVEWEEVYAGTFYGTLRSEIERLWADGKAVLFDIDVEGGLNIKNHYPACSLSVFVRPPSIEHLKQRLEARSTDTPESLKKRIDKAASELEYENKFDVVLINNERGQCQEEARKIVTSFVTS